MQLVLENLLPQYVSVSGDSDIWNRDLSLPKGTDLYIAAPSGSGKSSLIHFIYGVRQDYKGAIWVNDINIKTASAEEKAKLRQQVMSIVFQDLQLFPDQTVKENIEIKRNLQPFHSEDTVAAMADMLGIRAKLDQKVKHCSYGEQQRTAIIRALMQPFDYLLLDEPFSHLDEANRLAAMSLIRDECRARGASMIFADLGDSSFFESENRKKL